MPTPEPTAPALPDLSGITHWHEMTMRISDWLVKTAHAAGRREGLAEARSEIADLLESEREGLNVTAYKEGLRDLDERLASVSRGDDGERKADG